MRVKLSLEDERIYRQLLRLAKTEEYRATGRRYYANNRSKVTERKKEYERRNREMRLGIGRRHYAKNKDEINRKRREKSNRLYRDNIDFRIKRLLGGRIVSALNGRVRAYRTIEALGCSVADFRIYLESLFETGMTWENYGKSEGMWNVDHIIPCAVFDLSKPAHQKRCFHFSNMRPMWHMDNMRKQKKIITNQFNLL